MKNKKRFISLGLALAMTMSLTISAVATDGVTPVLNKSAYDAQIEEDMKLLERIPNFISSDELSVVSIDDNGEILYGLSISEDTYSIVSIYEDDTENPTVKFTEDGITNEISFMPDGTIILDGHELDFKYNVPSSNEVQAQAFIPYNYYSSTPLYGTASDYTVYCGVNDVNEVSFELPWSSLTKTTVSKLLALAMEVVLPSFGNWSDVIVDVAEAAVAAGRYIPEGLAYMSYRYQTYMLETQPAFSIQSKFYCRFYTQKNCTGTSINKTIYQGYYYG